MSKIELHSSCAPGDEVYLSWASLAKTPFEHPDWLLTWWDYFGANDELMLATVREDEQIVAVAPLWRCGRSIRFLGDGATCSDHLSLLIGDNSQANVARMLSWLFDRPGVLGCHLDLRSVDRGTSTEGVLHHNSSFLSLQSDAQGSAFVDLPNDWESYLLQLSKNHRKRCRRWWRQHFESGEVQQISTRSGWDNELAFEELVKLHKERRSHIQPGDDSFENDVFLSFLKHAFQLLSAQQVTTISGDKKPMAEISALVRSGTIVATELELADSTTVHAYQSGMKVDQCSVSIGSISLLARIKQAIEDNHSVYDFGRGLEEYKFHWSANVLQATDFRVWPSTIKGNLLFSSSMALEKTKDFARFARDFVLTQ